MPFPCETSHNALASSPPTDSHQRESTHLSFWQMPSFSSSSRGPASTDTTWAPKAKYSAVSSRWGGHNFKQNHRTASSLTLWCYSAWAKSLDLQLCQCQWLMAARDVVLDPKANHSAWGVDELWWYSMWWRIHVSSLFQHPALSPMLHMFIMCLKAKAGKGEHGKTSFTSTGVSTSQGAGPPASPSSATRGTASGWAASRSAGKSPHPQGRKPGPAPGPAPVSLLGVFVALTTETW